MWNNVPDTVVVRSSNETDFAERDVYTYISVVAGSRLGKASAEVRLVLL